MRRLFAGLQIALGILVMLTSGLCSAVLIFGDWDGVVRDPSVLLMPLLFGGLPFLAGYRGLQRGRTVFKDTDRKGP